MKRKGIHIPLMSWLKTAAAITAVLFFLQGTGVSFFSALPETKSRTAVCKYQYAKFQHEVKKSLKLDALTRKATRVDAVYIVSSTLLRSYCDVFPLFHAKAPVRGPPKA